MPGSLARMLVVVGALLLLSLRPLEGQAVDLLVSGGTVVDGSGGPARPADIAVAGGEVVAVGDLGGVVADDTIDARGLHVAPGFIDLHSHADPGLSDPNLADARNLVAQGITTVVVGQDGWHPWPVGRDLAGQARLWQRHGVGPNVIPLVGHLAARREVVGWDTSPPNAAENRAIAKLVGTYLDQGAWGLSTAVEFSPYVSAAEIVRSLRPVADRDGLYFSHLRTQADGITSALEEFLSTARETGVRSVVSHLKIRGARNWGLAPLLVGMLRDARQESLDVWADHTPYLTSSSDIALVPPVGPSGGEEGVIPPGAGPPDDLLRWGYHLDGRNPPLSHIYDLDFLLKQDPDRRQRIAESVTRRLVNDQALHRRRLRRAIADPSSADSLVEATGQRIAERGGPALIRVFDHPDLRNPGRTLDVVARDRGTTPERAAVELTIEGAQFVPIELSEDDIATIVREPFVAGSSDGWVTEHGHGAGSPPRSYGAFVRRLERYVVDRELLELPQAIRQVTMLPAEILGLRDRGRIDAGYAADLVIFDLDRLHDRATFEEPHRFPDGIEWVLVNGEAVVARGVATGASPGRVLLRGQPGGPGG